jgi:hypothetical protein
MRSEVNPTDDQKGLEQPPADELVPLWRGFASPAVEQQYLEHQLVIDLAQAKLFVIVIGMGVLVFVASDYRFFGATRQFLLLVGVRLLMLAGAAITMGVISKSRTPSTVRRTLLVYSIFVAASSLYIFSTRSASFVGPALVDVALVCIFYFSLPLPWLLQLIPALIATVGYVGLIWPNLPRDSPTRTALIATLVLANLLGAWSSMLLNYWKRRQFGALRREADLRVRLEQALSEVKTLRGILPICSHCKKVRDDAGYWHQVEAYVQDRTHAAFSHGICPECLVTYYPGPKRSS